MSVTWIGERPNPIVRAGMGPGILYNRDSSRVLYIGSDSSILEGNLNSASILDPQTSIYVGGDTDIWVCAPVGTDPNNPVAVDFIHSGRSEHFVSPNVLTPTLQQMCSILQDINTGIQKLVPPTPTPPVTEPELQIAGSLDYTFTAAGVRVPAETLTVTVPASTTEMLILATEQGTDTDVGGIMLEIQYQFSTDSQPAIVTVQTGYQGGAIAMSGFSPVIPLPSGATSAVVNALNTATAGTWTGTGAIAALFQ